MTSGVINIDYLCTPPVSEWERTVNSQFLKMCWKQESDLNDKLQWLAPDNQCTTASFMAAHLIQSHSTTAAQTSQSTCTDPCPLPKPPTMSRWESEPVHGATEKVFLTSCRWLCVHHFRVRRGGARIRGGKKFPCSAWKLFRSQSNQASVGCARKNKSDPWGLQIESYRT